jgi:hypothetical protein
MKAKFSLNFGLTYKCITLDATMATMGLTKKGACFGICANTIEKIKGSIADPYSFPTI